MKSTLFVVIYLTVVITWPISGCGGNDNLDDDGGTLFECTSDMECGPIEYCYRGYCIPIETITCTDDSDCLLAKICKLGVCEPPCLLNADCSNEEYCSNGHCLPGCSADDDCSAGKTCNLDLHECQQSGCTGDEDCRAGERCNFGTCVANCSSDENCSPGESCVDGVCVPPICNTDEDCSPGLHCLGGECTECRDEGDCNPGHYCAEDNECRECADDDPNHCGENCEVCDGETPHCLEGACAECLTRNDCEQDEPRHCTREGSCEPCTTPSACGPECVDCTDQSLTCSADGSECVHCVNNDDCGQGAWCNATLCEACDTNQRCGPECDNCEVLSLHCFGGVAGACSQCGADEHCPDGYWCEVGSCALCPGSDPLHCGANCAVCSFPVPHCVGGACVECANNADCSTGYWCESNTCRRCDTTNHCGPLCSDCGAAPATPICGGADAGCVCDSGSCGEYYECDGIDCQFCNTDAKCGANCGPCGGATPHCLDDSLSSVCVECLDDDHCASGEWCHQETGLCASCDVAERCGPTCAQCSGQTPDCGGVDAGCVCNQASCAPYHKCESGACRFCNTDVECGMACSPCGAGTPHCLIEGGSSRCVACIADEHCTDPEYPVCENGICQPPCTRTCMDGADSGETCANARVVSRADAGDTDGATRPGDILAGTNDDQTTCQSFKQSNGMDHYFQIYLYSGEIMDVSLDVTFNSSYFDGILFLYRSGDSCDGKTCSTQILCRDQWNNIDESFSYQAGEDGWYVIQVDSTWQIGQSQYELVIGLQCNQAGCGC